MDNTIFLTRTIDNDSLFGGEGFIDSIERKIRSISKGDLLEAVVCSGGGDIYQGNRIHGLLQLHEGDTKAIVTGIAASMAGLLLASFDKVVSDSNSRIMLHKAHVEDMDNISDEDRIELKKFNNMAYERIKNKILSKKGIDHKKSTSLLDKIFLDDSFKGDVNFTATEARDFGLVDEVIELGRVEGSPEVNKIAASLDAYNHEYSKLIYNKYKEMGLFSKKNPVVARTAELKAGGTIVFNSNEEKLSKGDEVSLIGSIDPVNGEVDLGENKTAKIVDSKVENVLEGEEMSGDVMTAISEIKDMVVSLIDRVSALEGGKSDDSGEEVDSKLEEVTNAVTEIQNALKGTGVVSSYQLPSVEKKQEVSNQAKNLGDSREQAIRLNEALNNKK